MLKVLLGIRLWSLLACFWTACGSLWNRVVFVGGLRAPFRRLRGSLGAVLGALWPLGGRLLAPFGSLWASPVVARSPLGRPWALLGPLWASPVAARALVGRLVAPAGRLWACAVAVWTLPGSTRACFGPLVGVFDRSLDASELVSGFLGVLWQLGGRLSGGRLGSFGGWVVSPERVAAPMRNVCSGTGCTILLGGSVGRPSSTNVWCLHGIGRDSWDRETSEVDRNK